MRNNICRAKGCTETIPHNHLMCRYHWPLVTAVTRAKVYRLYKAAPHSQAHHEAIADAQKEVSDYLAQRAAGWRQPHAV